MTSAFPGCAIELVPGSGGVFEVKVDGRKIFSKLKLKRFPSYREIPTLLGD